MEGFHDVQPDMVLRKSEAAAPDVSPNISQEDLILLSKSWDLTAHFPLVDWSKAYWILPLQDILKNVDGPHGVFADSMPVPGGGRMIQRTPNHRARYKGLFIMTTSVLTFQDSGTPRSMTSRLHRTLSCKLNLEDREG